MMWLCVTSVYSWSRSHWRSSRQSTTPRGVAAARNQPSDRDAQGGASLRFANKGVGLFADLSVSTVSRSEDDRGDRSRKNRGAEDCDFGVIMRRCTGREGYLRDQQRYGKPDAG